VSDSDAAGRAALRDPDIRRRIVERWGESVLDASGEIDRSALAAIVFADPAERRTLESWTHPWIEARRLELFAKAPADARALVIDAPLLLEAGLDAQCDAVIFVETDPALRQSRLAEKRGWSREEVARREHSQLPLDQKRLRADHVVQNNGDLKALKAQVSRVLTKIIESRRPRPRRIPGPQ
jgi:dephospho-CoA kinase